MEWREAIIYVLGRPGRAMHYVHEITKEILDEQLVDQRSANPRQTVSNRLTTSINNEGEDSPFVRVMPGYYKLREALYEHPAQDGEDIGDEPEGGIITSIGMYWNRADVNWGPNPTLLGSQHDNASPIDFCEQTGVYLLYNHNQVIYVGRSEHLGKRLYQHTRDRLKGRWNQFSWFGLRPIIINNDGATLGDAPDQYASKFMISVLEAVLIEACEPGQNRRRGDDFSAVEYIQVVEQ